MKLRWVDIVKGIAIIAVVFSHTVHGITDMRFLPLHSMGYSFWYVSVFFLLSGFFLKEDRLNKPLSFILSKLKSLYLLLLVFYIPAVLLHNSFINIGFYDPSIDYSGKIIYKWDYCDYCKNIIMTIFFMGREPIVGALWFVYVLLFANIGISVITYLLRKYYGKKTRTNLVRSSSNGEINKPYEITRCLFLFFLCLLSFMLTNKFNINIPRINNSITAMWLIYCGYILNNYLKVEYNNKYIVCICTMLLYHITNVYGGIALNNNMYADIVSLTIGSIAALYILSYIAKRIENIFLGRILALLGRKSFYIMALHFLGFKILSMLLNRLGYYEYNISSLSAPAGGNAFIALMYVSFAVLFSLLVVLLVSLIKKLLRKYSKIVNIH